MSYNNLNFICRAYVLCATIPACLRVFTFARDGSFGEPRDVQEIRTIARKCVLRRQPPLLHQWFRTVWSLLMLLTAAAATVCPLLYNYETQAFDLETVWPEILHNTAGLFSLAVAAANTLLFVMWITFVILNFTKYRHREDMTVRVEGNLLSYFGMEQLQQILSELTIYPQLCLASSQAMIADKSPFLWGSLAASLLLLLAVFGLRLYTVVQIRVYTRLYFKPLMFAIVSNYFCVIYLIVLLVITSPDNNFPLHLALSGLVLITTICNYCMFYLSHLYEITLQSCVNLLLLESDQRRQARSVLQTLRQIEPFHKNMYTMSMPCYGTLLYFWILPSTGLACYVVLVCDLQIMIPVVAWYIFHLAINYKNLLMSFSAHFTAIVIVFIMVLTLLFSSFLAFLIYGLTAIVLFFICVHYMRLCCCDC